MPGFTFPVLGVSTRPCVHEGAAGEGASPPVRVGQGDDISAISGGVDMT